MRFSPSIAGCLVTLALGACSENSARREPQVGGIASGGDATADAVRATAFRCPPGSEQLSPNIPANAGAPIENVPPGGFEPNNLEGPVWIGDSLYLSEIGQRRSADQPQGGRILRYQPGGVAEPFLLDVGTNGLAVSPAGELVAASQKDGAIVSFDLGAALGSSTPQRTYAGTYAGKRFSSPNDLTLRDDGNLYFTDPAYQAGSIKQDEERSYRVAPDGTVSVIAGAPSPPNGITLSKDQNTLYVGGAKLMAFELSADGAVGAGSDFPPDAALLGTDGLGLDCAGNLYVTLYSQGTIVVLSPDGSTLGTLEVGSGVTNVAFGGPQRQTLFITRMTPPSLYAVELGIPGYPY